MTQEHVPETGETQEEHPLAGLKVVVTVLDGGSVLIGVSRGAVDPHVENCAVSPNDDLRSILDLVPGVLERAAALWEGQPRFPNYQPPAAAAPAPGTGQQTARGQRGRERPDQGVQRPRMFD